MHTVAIVVWDDVEVFELAPACEVFGVDRPELVSPWYRMVLCAARPGPVPISPGLSVPAPHGLDAAVGPDTGIVPACANLPPGVPETLLPAPPEPHPPGWRLTPTGPTGFCPPQP